MKKKMQEEKSNRKLLREAVVGKRESGDWDAAKKEWELLTIYNQDNYCVCGQPIVENCVVRNCSTLEELVIGNVCVNHFQEESLSVDKNCRTSLKKLVENPGGYSASPSLVRLVQRLGILSEKEEEWYLNWTTGKLSRSIFNREHQLFDEVEYNARSNWNHLILYGFDKDRPKCERGKLTKPRQSRTTGRFFYSCCAWPNGCNFIKSI